MREEKNNFFVYEQKGETPFVFDLSAYEVKRELETTRENKKISLKQYETILTNKDTTENYVKKLVPRDIDRCVIRQGCYADLSNGTTQYIYDDFHHYRNVSFHKYPDIALFYTGANGNNWLFDTTNSKEEVSCYVNIVFAKVGNTRETPIKVTTLDLENNSGLGDKTLSINSNIVRRLIKYGMFTKE